MGEGSTKLLRTAVGKLNQRLRQGKASTNRRTQVVDSIRPQLPDARIRSAGTMIHHHARSHKASNKPEHTQCHQLAHHQEQQGQDNGACNTHPGESSRGQRVHPSLTQRHNQCRVGSATDRFLPLWKTGKVHQTYADAQNQAKEKRHHCPAFAAANTCSGRCPARTQRSAFGSSRATQTIRPSRRTNSGDISITPSSTRPPSMLISSTWR